jgi:hypothetical protein
MPPNGARVIRYSLVKQLTGSAPLPADATTVFAGLHLPAAIDDKFVAPTIDHKPLTDFVDSRGEVLVALVNARKRGAFKVAKEFDAVDPQRFQLMSRRLDNALATTVGVQIAIVSKERLLCRTQIKFEISLSNTGDAEVVIKNVRSRCTLDRPLNRADKLLRTKHRKLRCHN